MATYKIRVRREIIEDMVVRVDAPTLSRAKEYAIAEAENADDSNWEIIGVDYDAEETEERRRSGGVSPRLR